MHVAGVCGAVALLRVSHLLAAHVPKAPRMHSERAASATLAQLLDCSQSVKLDLQSEGGGAAERSSSRELGPEDWDGRRIRRPLQRASVEARRRSSFKGNNRGDNEPEGAVAAAPQPDGSGGSVRRLDAASANGGNGDGGRSKGGGGGSGGDGAPAQSVNGGGAADKRPAGLGSKA